MKTHRLFGLVVVFAVSLASVALSAAAEEMPFKATAKAVENATQTATTIRFTISETGHDKLPGGQVLVTRASGSGTLTLGNTPQARAVNESTSATGTIHFHGWRIVGHRVIDDANLSMNVVSGTYRFTNRVQNVNLQTTVTESDPNEKFTCPVGTAGRATLLDGKVKSQPDSFATGDFCGLHILDFGGTVGAPAHVVVMVKQGAP
jgi:hypothetical protein